MRVLVFQGFVDPAGRTPETLLAAWPSLPGMAEGLRRAGADVAVVVAARHDADLTRFGVRYRFVDEGRGRGLRRHLGMRAAPHPRRSLAWARSVGADVIHLHGLSFPRQAAALARPGVPLLAQDHKDRPVTGWRRPLHARAFAALDGVSFTHREQARPFVEAGMIEEDLPVFEIVEGSTTFAPGDRDAARARIGVWGAPALLWVGDLNEVKDPMTVLDGVALAAGAVPTLRLWMVFRGGAREAEVRRRVADERALSERVHLVGPVEHGRMEAYMRAADVLVTGSRWEGSGYALIEAMACGTAAVVTDIPPHRAILGGDPPGAFFPVGDGVALAGALRSVAPRTRSLAAAARDRFVDALSWDRIGEALLGAYEALRAGRGNGRGRP